MPIPVMTTRLMCPSPCLLSLSVFTHRFRSRRRGARLEQPDPQILGAIDNLAIGGKPPVGDAQPELHAHHALDVNVVHNLSHVRHHLAGELQLAEAKRPAAALAAGPAKIEAEHLPQRVEAETAGHYGIALEMAAEEPEVRLDVELRADQTLAVFAAGRGNVG